MATLTWRNVTGDETEAGASSLKHAGSLFSKAFESFSGAIEGRQKRETKANTEQVLNQIRSIGTVEDFDAQSGQLNDLNAMKEAAGGNLDTSAISKALSAKRPDLIKTGRAEEVFQRGEETRIRNETIGQIPNQILDANLPGQEGALDYKGQVAQTSQQIRAVGGSAKQVQEGVAALKSALTERASLSPTAKAAVEQQTQELEILSQAKMRQIKTTLDETLKANPEAHTLNAQGAAIAIGDVHDKIRKQYPQGSFWGGSGGDELSEMIGEYQSSGITIDGEVGTRIGDKYKKGTVEVEPWMYNMAMDIAGQTPQDAVGSPTLTTSLFRKTLADLAFDPKYKNYALKAKKARRQFERETTSTQLARLRGASKFSSDIKTSQEEKLIQQLQREAK